jgi:hypothetical protein
MKLKGEQFMDMKTAEALNDIYMQAELELLGIHLLDDYRQNGNIPSALISKSFSYYG